MIWHRIIFFRKHLRREIRLQRIVNVPQDFDLLLDSGVVIDGEQDLLPNYFVRVNCCRFVRLRKFLDHEIRTGIEMLVSSKRALENVVPGRKRRLL